MKLIIVEGDFYYRAGDIKIVGADWTYKNNLSMTICGDEISHLYIYKEISPEDFLYCLSRVRGREYQIQKHRDRGIVFASLDGLWIGEKQFLYFDKDFVINVKEIKEKYINYWKDK